MSGVVKIDFQWKSEDLLNRDNEYTITVERSGNLVGFDSFLNDVQTSIETTGYKDETPHDKEFLACIMGGKTVKTYREKEAKDLYRRMQVLGAYKHVLDRMNEPLEENGTSPSFDVTLSIKGVPTLGIYERVMGYGGTSQEEKKQQDEQVKQAYVEAGKAAVNKAQEAAGQVVKSASSWFVPVFIVVLIVSGVKGKVGL